MRALGAAILAVTVLIGSTSGVANTVAIQEQPDGSELGAASDLQQYAELHGTTLQQAQVELGLQEAIGELEERLSEAEADTFAGLWIEHAPAVKVVALFTEDGGTKLSRFVQGGPLERLSEARPAARPLRQLLDDARAIRGGGVAPFDLSIDVKRNMIEIRVESIDAFDRWASANSIALPPSADIRRVEAIARPAANIYGGLSLTVQGCTSGFSVRKAGTGDGITTAGHCGNTGVSITARTCPSRARRCTTPSTSNGIPRRAIPTRIGSSGNPVAPRDQ